MPRSAVQRVPQPQLQELRSTLDSKLIEYLNQYPYSSNELKESALYSVGSAGHRWRPILFIKIYEKLVSRDTSADVLPIACALEFLHTASLILDDLPSMDDGKLRRGREACHRRFGESRTILAAHWLCDAAQYYVHEFALTSGICDVEKMFLQTKAEMMKGQILDLERTDLDQDDIIEKCWLNSGALYSFSASIPAHIVNDIETANTLRGFGYYLGTAYQIADDIADVTSTVDVLGKDVLKDGDRKTLATLCGVTRATEIHLLYKTKALNEIKKLRVPTDDLAEIVELICMF